MLLIYVGFFFIALGVFVLFKKIAGETEIVVFGIKLKSNNSAILLICFGGIFILIGNSNYPIEGDASTAQSSNSETPEVTTTDNEMPQEVQTSTNKQTYSNQENNIDNSTADYNTTTVGKFPEGSNALLGYDDVKDKSLYELKIMRNEIFARHGYIFKTNDMRKYFNNQSWYTPLYDNVDNKLTTIERQNIKFIKQYE